MSVSVGLAGFLLKSHPPFWISGGTKATSFSRGATPRQEYVLTPYTTSERKKGYGVVFDKILVMPYNWGDSSNLSSSKNSNVARHND